MKSMSKHDLARAVSARLKAAGAHVVHQHEILTILQTAVDAVVAHFGGGGDTVTFRGFGTFRRHHRVSFKTRSPRTGETISVPATTALVFKVSREIRSRINS